MRSFESAVGAGFGSSVALAEPCDASNDRTGTIGIASEGQHVEEGAGTEADVEPILSRLRVSELRYRTMVRSAGDAILVSDMQSAFFVDVNPAACELFGYTEDELRHRNGRSLCAPDEGPTVDRMSTRLVATGYSFEPQVQMCRRDGSRFWGSLKISAYRVDGQQLFVAIIRDVTDEVQRQQQLTESNLRLEQAHERLVHSERLAALGQLSATVAHEINNPLQFIDVNLGAIRDLLTARGASEEITQLLDDVRDGVDRISAITRDLSSFSRADPRQVMAVRLDEVVERACRMAKSEIRHRARLVLDLKTSRPVTADLGKLTQVVTNLMVNAAHAIEEGRADCNRISVTTEQRDDGLVLVVEDTGKGIPAEIRERIFEPFFTTKPAGRGGGLGLAVCMEIVRLHQGMIRVDSELGRGTRFEVWLPFENGLAKPSQPEPRASATEGRGRVLIVDDDDLVRRGLGRMLSLDHDVVLADGGEEGLTILARDRDFDAILCDLMMPVMDGPAFHAALTELTPELLPRLAFCSGGAFTPRVRGFIESIPNTLLAKPMRRAELLDAIAVLMAGQRASRGP